MMDHLPATLAHEAAVISDCERYRYWLRRDFGMFGRPIAFVMLNPSTADAEQDDPTIRRCMGFAKAWGGSELIVVNLFALRATKPETLWAPQTADPVGPLNDDAIREAGEYCHGNDGLIVAAWGNHGAFMNRGRDVLERLWQEALPIHYLKMTGAKQPSHPLYLKADLRPIEWAPR